MKRREFIMLGGGVAMWPLASRAQQPAMPVIGFLNSTSPGQYADRLRGFRQGLGEAGFVEGRNLAIEYRWAEGQYDRLPPLAADLVSRQVTVIVANGPAASPAKAATATIPVVFVTSADPVAAGLVASMHGPGGNVTGVTGLNVEVAPKLLELLRELVPTATMFALLLNPTSPNAEPILRGLQAAASTLGIRLDVLHASTERDIAAAFATSVQRRAGALVIGSDSFFTGNGKLLAALTLRHAMPAVYSQREFAAAGGLMSYGGSIAEMFRQAAAYTGRILKGDKPADLPVQQATKVELVINMKTAKQLGLTFPLSLLGRADEVIE